MTARLVLGELNMDEWNHARFLSTLNLIYWYVSYLSAAISHIYFRSPHRGCDETFDADDVAPAPSGVDHAETLVQVGINLTTSLPFSYPCIQCPRCRGSLCKACKSVWHDSKRNIFLYFRGGSPFLAELTCEMYQALPENERAPEDVAFANLAKQEKWRRCPKVRAFCATTHKIHILIIVLGHG
jgi:hypothetical protein